MINLVKDNYLIGQIILHKIIIVIINRTIICRTDLAESFLLRLLKLWSCEYPKRYFSETRYCKCYTGDENKCDYKENGLHMSS